MKSFLWTSVNFFCFFDTFLDRNFNFFLPSNNKISHQFAIHLWITIDFSKIIELEKEEKKKHTKLNYFKFPYQETRELEQTGPVRLNLTLLTNELIWKWESILWKSTEDSKGNRLNDQANDWIFINFEGYSRKCTFFFVSPVHK